MPNQQSPPLSIMRRKVQSAESKRPGRPEGQNFARDAIMDTAEIVFADRGYAGTTLREIANHAGVTQALINYYFGSKHGLFSEMFLRRGKIIGQTRLELLKRLQNNPKPATVEQLVDAFLSPIIALNHDPSGHAFLRLQARIHTEPAEISYALRNEVYNPSTQLFMQLLQQAVPGLSASQALWRTTLLVGAYLYAFSDTSRMEEIVPGASATSTAMLVEQEIKQFLVSGLRS